MMKSFKAKAIALVVLFTTCCSPYIDFSLCQNSFLSVATPGSISIGPQFNAVAVEQKFAVVISQNQPLTPAETAEITRGYDQLDERGAALLRGLEERSLR